MAPTLIIEVLEPGGAVHHRVRVETLPATIGRAYTSDVILDDPYVCPHHARIALAEDGTLVADDLDSVNGLREHGRGEHARRVPIRPGSELRIGRTVLRVCFPDQVVAATAVEGAPANRLRRLLASTRVLAGVCAATLGVILLQTYMADSEGTSFAGVAGGTLAIFVLLGFWSGCWAIANRIVAHSFRFAAHFALVCTAVLGVTLLGSLGEWIDFFLPSAGAGTALGFLGGAAALVGLFYGHLALVSSLPPRRLWRTSLAISGAIAAIVVLLADAGDELLSGSASYSAVLKPVGTRWVHTVSLDDFLTRSSTIRDQVDELARKE